eukprot:4220071-Lingulodinium_polyedra.AAC.1
MPPDGIAYGQPFVKEGPDSDGTVEVSLAAGDLLIADLLAGARVTLRGAGEQAEVVSTRRAWLRVSVPSDAGV